MNAPHHKPKTTSGKRAINVSLDPDTVAAAKELGINISQACEVGLTARVKKVRDEQSLAENMEAIEATNAWVEENGLRLQNIASFDGPIRRLQHGRRYSIARQVFTGS